MYDQDDRPIVDLISGIAVSVLGHQHPTIVEAVQKQAGTYMHLMVYGEFMQGPQVELSKILSDTLPNPLDSVFVVNSGSEAVEGALKLAKRYTGRRNIVAFEHAYHGSSHGALSVSGNEEYKRAFYPLLPNVFKLPFNETSQLDRIDENTACVILETIQGEAGVVAAEADFIRTVRSRCTEVGALMILDEIQCGFGRSGSFWAFEQYNVVPDILLTAKGMGGGMPIGAFISSQKIMNTLTHGPILGHISTFGGHPVSCAASLATIKTILSEGLINQVNQKANLFKELLLPHPKCLGIRNVGLMMAMEIGSFEQVKRLIELCLEKGVLSDWFLNNDTSIRIAPPLIITEEEIKKTCSLLTEAMDELD
jgi:acetylornithine/succinyldiaminopimelate/putrescine aminotransferase